MPKPPSTSKVENFDNTGSNNMHRDGQSNMSRSHRNSFEQDRSIAGTISHAGPVNHGAHATRE